MIKAIAVDDEKNALGILEYYARQVDDLVLAGTFTDLEMAGNFISQSQQVDLVFLDVNLGQTNGLLLARNLPQGIRVVLTTAYSEYALEGYDLNILDYLLKPFTFERFERSLQKFRAYSLQPQKEGSLGKSVQLVPSNDDFIFVKAEHKVLKINLNDLLIIEGAGNYVALHTEKSKVLTLQNMKAFEDYLLPYGFIRVHKSYIISARHITTIEHNSVLVGGKIVPIGESYRSSLFNFIDSISKQF